MASAAKTLFLIRHAHRETVQRNQDNGLSEKGQRQTRRLVKYFQQRIKHEGWEKSQCGFESSAKVRCLETLQPVAQLMGQAVHVQDGLMEQSSSESFSKFQVRIQAYIQHWIESKVGVQFVSSHGDVLPLLTYHLIGAAVDFKKGGFVELEWEAGQAHIKQVIPSLKAFYG